jgi:hypothetical protein
MAHPLRPSATRQVLIADNGANYVLHRRRPRRRRPRRPRPRRRRPLAAATRQPSIPSPPSNDQQNQPEDKSKNTTKKEGRRIVRQKRRTKNKSARDIKEQDKEGKKTNLRRVKMRRTRNTNQPTRTCQSHARQLARASSTEVRLSVPRLLFSLWGVVRVVGQFSQTCRLTAENDEGPTA